LHQEQRQTNRSDGDKMTFDLTTIQSDLQAKLNIATPKLTGRYAGLTGIVPSTFVDGTDTVIGQGTSKDGYTAILLIKRGPNWRNKDGSVKRFVCIETALRADKGIIVHPGDAIVTMQIA
jgi:hypothetical protein